MIPWPLVSPLAIAWVGAALLMACLWLRQRVTRDATVVDVAWAFLLGACALFYAVEADGQPDRRLGVAAAVVLASWRLAGYLWLDRGRKGLEDGRYRDLRARWGDQANTRFFWFFQAQALLAVLLSVPFLLAAHSDAELGPMDAVALVLWLVALVGESIADRQLARFRANAANKGRTCRAGLWRVSRHPNYFFQWILWCAYALAASSAGLGWLAWISPISVLFLVLKVTGIPPTEAQALRSRGDDYRRYQQETSAFVPWFPKKVAL